MNERRSSYLNQVWQPYPKMTAALRKRLNFARVVLPLSEQRLRVRPWGSEDLTDWELPHENTGHDELRVLGEAVPSGVLAPGDIIARDPESMTTYLLAPCRGGSLPSKPEPLRPSTQWLRSVHAFFSQQGFESIDTPYLVASPGVDQHIDFMEVRGATTGRKWFLPTSPEIHLKKELCRGEFANIYEIKSCFRDDLIGPWHQPEFLMLEWYRAFSDLEDIKKDVLNLFQCLEIFYGHAETWSVSELFERCYQKSLSTGTSREELRELCYQFSINTHETDDWNDLFHRLFMERVEPFLQDRGLCFVEKFPPSQASLSQTDSEGWAQRFEVYWRGTELANAYLELNDPDENRSRFLSEQDKRQRRGAEPSGWDESFFQILQLGMPPAAGIALGLSRLYWLEWPHIQKLKPQS